MECGLTADYKDPDAILEQGRVLLNTVKYMRKPFEVDAVQVTVTNLAEVAEWCQGEVLAEGTPPAQYVKVNVERVLNDRQTKAFIGDWVLYAGQGFKVYTDRAFKKSFQAVTVPAS
jgi:hypothetical protein